MTDVLLMFVAVIFVAINGLTMLAWAAQMGYKMKPTAFAYFFAGFANLATGNVVPFSGQSSILTVSNFVKNTNERVAALLIAVLVMVPLGALGAVSRVAAWAGPPVILGMMAGVGLMVAGISLDMLNQDKRTGAIAFASALVTWYFTRGNPNQLVYVIAVSVTVSTADFLLFQKDPETGMKGRRVSFKRIAQENGFTGDMDENDEDRFWRKEFWEAFKITRPTFGLKAVYYALGFMCINIGTNIAFGNITAGFAGIPPGEVPLDTITIINSLADIPAILFGGMPIEAIISATAQSPWPVLAGALMMLLLGALLLTGTISKMFRYVPAQSIAGFLFIIGFFATFHPNTVNAMAAGAPMQTTAAITVTAVTKNPFLGLLAGVGVRYLGL